MDDLTVAEADLNWRYGHFSSYGEYVHVYRPKQPWGALPWQGPGTDGSGFYIVGTYTGNGYAFQAEKKYYRYLLTPFMVPPTARHYTEKNQSDPDDDRGYNFQLTMTPY